MNRSVYAGHAALIMKQIAVSIVKVVRNRMLIKKHACERNVTSWL